MFSLAFWGIRICRKTEDRASKEGTEAGSFPLPGCGRPRGHVPASSARPVCKVSSSSNCGVAGFAAITRYYFPVQNLVFQHTDIFLK